MADTITLRGLRGHGYHGVLASERAAGQEFIVDVTLTVDTARAAASDDLADTVDYSAVATDVHALVTGEPFDLIETLADRIATAVLARPGVQRAVVTVHKPHAPIDVPFADVEVRIERGATGG